MGGSASIEFMSVSDAGEDWTVTCSECDYAANLEKAVGVAAGVEDSQEVPEVEAFPTPGIRRIRDLADFNAEATPERQIKTLVYMVDGVIRSPIRSWRRTRDKRFKRGPTSTSERATSPSSGVVNPAPRPQAVARSPEIVSCGEPFQTARSNASISGGSDEPSSANSSMTIFTTSRMFARASSRVLPCVLAPLRAGQQV
jgi:hypothetical protein